MSTPPTFSGGQLGGRENRAHSNCRNSPIIFDPNLQKGNKKTQLVVTLPFGKGSRWNRRHNKNPAHRLNSKWPAWCFRRREAVKKHPVFQLRNDSIWGKQNPLKSIENLNNLNEQQTQKLPANFQNFQNFTHFLLHPSIPSLLCPSHKKKTMSSKPRFWFTFQPWTPQHRSDMETDRRVLSPSTTQNTTWGPEPIVV